MKTNVLNSEVQVGKPIFLIVDEDTGNYVSSDSIFLTADSMIYSTHTGRASGLEYSRSRYTADRIIANLTKTLKKYRIHKDFKVIEIDKENLLMGNMVVETVVCKCIFH